jgi:hypothetical protein
MKKKYNYIKTQNSIIRKLLIDNGLYNIFINKSHGDKSIYNRKTKHKKKNND